MPEAFHWRCFGGDREPERQTHMRQRNAERDRLEVEVTKPTAETEPLTPHMERVSEDEKARWARELHAELGGSLTAVRLDRTRARQRMPETGLELERLAQLNPSLNAVIALKRDTIQNLRPSSLSKLGLQATLLNQCSGFALRADLEVKPDIPPAVATDEPTQAVYRVAQQVFTNMARYAQATQVQVRVQMSLAVQRKDLALTVTDNVNGLALDHAADTGRHGRQGMKFRVNACGGTRNIRSTLAEGTEICASFPLHGLRAA